MVVYNVIYYYQQSTTMKLFFFLFFATLALSQNIFQTTGLCFASAKTFEAQAKRAISATSLDSMIDSLETLSEKVPSLLRSCGAQKQAEVYEEYYPKACTKLLAKQAKIAVKILKLSAEDRNKNEKQIILYTAMFETIYKTQVQKKCPAFSNQHIMETVNKGECAEGVYQFSLKFEKLDNDLAAGNFNKSLNDMGVVMKQLPLALDSCNQAQIANKVRFDFPEQCLNSIGALIREIATIEHHYTHFEWLQKHLKDFTKSVIKVKATCPALQKFI